MQSPFNDKQIENLNKPLDTRFKSTRKGAGNRVLKYIEGHDAIDQADRLFGYGNWGYETLACEQTIIYDSITGNAVGITYKAKVKLDVRGCIPVVEVGSQPVAVTSIEDHIMGKRRKDAKDKNSKKVDDAPFNDFEIAIARTIIMESHEQAEKGAVTDAVKRALRTFGEQFGNGFYGDGRIDMSEDEENREEKEGQAAPSSAASQRTAPQNQLTKITLTKEDRAAYADEALLFASNVSDEDYTAFCTLIGAEPSAKWGDQEYSASHQKLAQYGVPASMQEKYNSYNKQLTAPAMQRFTKRILKKSLADSSALDVARSIELLDKALFLEGLAKLLDPEHTKIKEIGAKHADSKTSVDHVLDCIGHPKEDDLLREYKGFLRNQALADPDKLKDFPAALKERHAEAWKRLTAPKKEQKAS